MLSRNFHLFRQFSLPLNVDSSCCRIQLGRDRRCPGLSMGLNLLLLLPLSLSVFECEFWIRMHMCVSLIGWCWMVYQNGEGSSMSWERYSHLYDLMHRGNSAFRENRLDQVICRPSCWALYFIANLVLFENFEFFVETVLICGIGWMLV